MNTEALTIGSSGTLVQQAGSVIQKASAFEWLFIILGGLPLYLPLLFVLGEQGLSSQNPIYWYFWVNAIISAPHVYSTYCRLARKIQENKVSYFVGFPTYIFIVLLLLLAQSKGYWLQALTAVNVVQSFHYLRQVFGVYRIYGVSPQESKSEKDLAFYSFHFAIPLFVFGRWDTLYTVWGGKPSDAIIPVDFTNEFMNFCWHIALVAIVLAIILEFKKFRNPIAYSPIGAAILLSYFLIHWFGFLSIDFFQRGFFAVTIFHAVQYLALTWKMEWKSSTQTLFSKMRRIHFNFAFPLIWLIVFILGFMWENKIVNLTNFIIPNLSIILLGAVSAHHYVVDAFIWRKQAGA